MRRKFTVYGLRFSKTSFWNRINTGFTDPAVATARTACGIETIRFLNIETEIMRVATARTACGIETYKRLLFAITKVHQLQQRVPLAVLKQSDNNNQMQILCEELQQRVPLAVLKLVTQLIRKNLPRLLQQRVPLAVLKRSNLMYKHLEIGVATARTACGIETLKIMRSVAKNIK